MAAADELELALSGLRTAAQRDDHLAQAPGGQAGPGEVPAVLPPQHLVHVVELVARRILEAGLDAGRPAGHVQQVGRAELGMRGEPIPQ